MICLNNTDTLEGGASVDAVVDYTVHGLVGTAFTQIAQGKLSNTDPSVLYTAAAAISIVSVIFVNTHSAAVTVNLYLDPANAGTPRRMIPKALSLGIGYSMHFDGSKITVMDSNGNVLSVMSAHKLTHQDGGADEISVQGLSGLLAEDQHVLDAEVLAVAPAIPGAVIQAVIASSSTEITFTDQDVEHFMLETAITPKRSNSVLIAIMSINGIDNGNNGRLSFSLKHETVSGGTTGTQIAKGSAAQDSTANYGISSTTVMSSVAPGNVTTRYFKGIVTKHDVTNTWYVNRWSDSTSCILVLEVGV